MTAATIETRPCTADDFRGAQDPQRLAEIYNSQGFGMAVDPSLYASADFAWLADRTAAEAMAVQFNADGKRKPAPVSAAAPGEPEVTDRAAMRERYIRNEVDKLEMLEEARRRVRAGRTAQAPPPALLNEFLAVPDEDARYRLDRLLPVGGRAILAAQFKAGKSTLIGNLLRSLADGVPFLGAHRVEIPEGRIVLLDNELDSRTLRRWLRDQGIVNESRVAVISLRGRVSSFNILDPSVRAQWAQMLSALGPSFVVLDCLRPIIDALGLSEDKDAGRVLVAFDELLDACGASEAVVVHHMGHAGERTRGDSRLRDWPDVEWRLVRQGDEPSSPRFFTAYGRDVDVPEAALDFAPETRRLTLAGGSRKDARSFELLPAIVELLHEQPGLSGRGIEQALAEQASRGEVRAAVQVGIRDAVIRTAPGMHRSTLHYARDDARDARFSAPDQAGALATRGLLQLVDDTSVRRPDGYHLRWSAGQCACAPSVAASAPNHRRPVRQPL